MMQISCVWSSDYRSCVPPVGHLEDPSAIYPAYSGQDRMMDGCAGHMDIHGQGLSLQLIAN